MQGIFYLANELKEVRQITKCSANPHCVSFLAFVSEKNRVYPTQCPRAAGLVRFILVARLRSFSQ